MASKPRATDSNTVAPISSKGDNPSGYSKRHSRITKENLFMILALCMQDFPLEDDEGPRNSGDPEQVPDSEVPEAPLSRDGENSETGNGNDTKQFEGQVESGKDPKPPCKKVGAVLVSPNDIVYAVDCTRDGVHGIARLLIKHYDIPEGCKVFVSRKPCSFCTKLLVQSGKVKRVFYLPFEPEYHTYSESNFKDETVRVDTLFKASAIGQSVFVPIVEKAVRDDAEEKEKTPGELIGDIEARKKKFFGAYYNEKWMNEAMERLPWPAFDKPMKDRVKEDFEGTMEWMARILVLLKKANTFILHSTDTDTSDVPFNPADVDNTLQLKQAVHLLEITQFLAKRSDDPITGVPFNPVDNKLQLKQAVRLLEMTQFLAKRSDDPITGVPFNPVANELQLKQAVRLLEMAQFLAKRSDDPITGVGAIITDQQMEIKALGWNGFPLKALYGEFPRASKHDEADTDKKYPYVIHAEQNALLMRNDKSLKGGILFVTKTPCNECVPLLEMQGIKTVISDEEMSQGSLAKKEANAKHLSYAKFPEKVRDGKFICFERQTIHGRHDKGITPSQSVKKDYSVGFLPEED